MATIYRKMHTKLLPDGAELFTRKGQQYARWVDGRGKNQMAELSPDGQKIIIESRIWHARYRDADGLERRVSTGCRDEQAARRMLSDKLADAEKVRSGILTHDEAHTAGHVDRPLAGHFDDYLEFLKAKTVRGRKVSAGHRYNVEKQLTRLSKVCRFLRIGDINAQSVIRWMNEMADAGEMAPRTVNTHRAALVAFCNWAVKDRRLTSNPLSGLSKADESDVRRERRALLADEVAALLEAARTRPLRDASMVRRGKRKGQMVAKISDNVRDRLERLGRERALIYKTLIYTGLRKGELASVTVSDVHLDEQHPYIELAAKNAKNGKGARIPLRADLGEELCGHLAEKLAELRRRTLADGRRELPQELSGDTKLFNLPSDSIRVFDRDLVAAGLAREVKDSQTGKMRIDKTDAQGRTMDIHCLRHTFATMLSKAGVAPRIAQELLRHSDIRLTMNTYTHLQLVDTASAVESLPGVENGDSEPQERQRTGTYDRVWGAENGAVFGAERQANRGNARQPLASWHGRKGKAESPQTPVNTAKKQPPSSSDRGCRKAGEGSRTLNNQLGRLEL